MIPDSKGGPDGVYAKSLRRQSDKESVQYEVQPTNNAYLQIVITHTPEVWGTGPHYLYYVGVIRNLVSRANGLESYTLEDAELYNPTDQWELVPLEYHAQEGKNPAGKGSIRFSDGVEKGVTNAA